MLDHLKELDRQVDELEAQIQAWHRNSDLSTKIAQVPVQHPLAVYEQLLTQMTSAPWPQGAHV